MATRVRPIASRARRPLLELALVVALAGLLTLFLPAPGTSSGIHSSAGPIATFLPAQSDPFAAAIGSLAHGSGPAGGTPASCSGGAGGSTICSLAAIPLPAAASSPTWTNLSGFQSNTPPARPLGNMAYDAADGYVVLFGGCSVWSCSGSPMGDTWIFASDQWTDVTGSQVTSPPPRSIAQMTYDPIDREVVLFGGLGPTQSYALNDTWAFSGGQWTNLTANLTTSPPARYRGTMAYDGHDHYVLLYGGTHDTSTASPYNDTWTFVNQTWTNITKKVTSNLPGRLRAGMTYDAADGYILMFGGCTSASCPTADTWKYVNHTWTSLTGSLTTAPSARVYSQLTYDARDGYAVLFGGGQSTAGPGDRDTWAFTGGAWKNISGGLSGMPPARGFDELAYDGAANLTLMFSGYYDSTTALLNDTWSFGPEIVGTASTNPPQMDLGQSATFTVGAVSNFEPLTYTYSNLPPGCSSLNRSNLACTPTAAGNYSPSVAVSDTNASSLTLPLGVWVVADPRLTAYSISPGTVTSGSPIAFSSTVSGGLSPYRFSWRNLPGGCSGVNAANFSCTPSSAGTFTVELQVIDNVGYSVFGNATVLVNPAPSVTTFTASPAVVDVNQNVSFQVTASGGTAPLSYAYTGLPAGCASANNAQLLCVPSASGNFRVRVQVTDSFGWNAFSNASLTVNRALAISSAAISVSRIDLGQSITLWVNGSGGTMPYSYSFTGQPSGCSLSGVSTGSCTPTATGDFNITATVSDITGAQESQTFALRVEPKPSIVSFNATPSITDVGVNTTLRVTPMGGIGPYSFSYSGLPLGCTSINDSRLVCAAVQAAPLVTVSVTVTDAVGETATQTVTFRINADPSITSFAATPGTVSLGNSVALNVSVSGGTSPFNYTYSRLPSGCVSMNTNALSCTPSKVGTYTVHVTVEDAAGYRVSFDAGFVVQPAPSGTSPLAGSTLEIVGIGVVAAVAVAVALIAMRRRGRRPGPPSEAQPAPEASAGEASYEDPSPPSV